MRLILLFTYGMSLDSWRRQGLIDRELSYYRHLQRAGVADVDLFTYQPVDAALDGEPTGFGVLARPRLLGPLLYSLLGPLLRRQAFRRAAIVKSNQSRGAWAGVVAKWLYPRALFVVRCGWVRTRQMMVDDERLSGYWLRWAEAVEARTFKAADVIFVTSSADRDYVLSTYGIADRKIVVMPNAVDTTLFYPLPAVGPPDGETRSGRLRVVSVGRVVPMKNFQALIEAVARLDAPADLTIIGDGPYREELQRIAREANTSVIFQSCVPNSALPDQLRRADIFVMPQLYGAGMSKVILEAMACGLIVVASDIEAHRGVIEDGVNGFLCHTDVAAIGACLRRVLALDAASRRRICERARREAEEKYSMAALALREADIYRAMLGTAMATSRAAP